MPPVSVHRRRRMVAMTIGVCVVVGLLYVVNTPSSPTPSAAGQFPDTAATAASEIPAVLASAQQWEAAHATFTGFTVNPMPGLRVGAYGPGMVVSYSSGGVCQYSGILPSGTKATLTDPTGAACTDGAIAQATQALVAAAAASTSNDLATLANEATQVTLDLVRYANANTASGAPSFSGINPSFGVAGATVKQVSPDGLTATVQIASGTSCEVLTVSSAGTTSAPASC